MKSFCHVRSRLITSSALLLGGMVVPPLRAAAEPQGVSLQVPGITMHGDSTSWTIIVLLTVLTLLPALVLSMTPFVRILIIFHFLRQALGPQTAPTNQTLMGLALFLTYFVMQPVGVSINKVSV